MLKMSGPNTLVDEVAHIVHSVVVFFDGPVNARLFVPAVELELPDTVLAPSQKKISPVLSLVATLRYHQDRVRGFLHIEPAVPPDGLYEAGGRRSTMTARIGRPPASFSSSA